MWHTNRRGSESANRQIGKSASLQVGGLARQRISESASQRISESASWPSFLKRGTRQRCWVPGVSPRITTAGKGCRAPQLIPFSGENEDCLTCCIVDLQAFIHYSVGGGDSESFNVSRFLLHDALGCRTELYSCSDWTGDRQSTIVRRDVFATIGSAAIAVAAHEPTEKLLLKVQGDFGAFDEALAVQRDEYPLGTGEVGGCFLLGLTLSLHGLPLPPVFFRGYPSKRRERQVRGKDQRIFVSRPFE